MTRELLRSYQDVLAEIEDLTKTTADAVKASLHNFPYTVHTQLIEAAEDFVRPNPTRLDKLAKLRAKKKEIESWMERLPYRVKKIAWLYANGESWIDIATELKNETPASARAKLMRAIEKY